MQMSSLISLQANLYFHWSKYVKYLREENVPLPTVNLNCYFFLQAPCRERVTTKSSRGMRYEQIVYRDKFEKRTFIK
jgi:hypothetical protein